MALSTVHKTRRPERAELFWSVGRAERIRLAASLVGAAGRGVIVARSAHDARRIADELSRHGVPAASIDRREFTAPSVRVQVVTDESVDACPPAPCVIQYDPAASPRAHRRRAELAGAGGVVVTLVVPERDGEARELLARLGTPGEIAAPDVDGLRAVLTGAGPDREPAPSSLRRAASRVRAGVRTGGRFADRRLRALSSLVRVPGAARRRDAQPVAVRVRVRGEVQASGDQR